MAALSAGESPAYVIIANAIRDEIRQGKFDDGRRLPTEAEIAARYNVSRQTVRRAFQDLVADEMVYRVPGRGTFVNASPGRYLRQLGSIEDLLSLSFDTTMEVVSQLQRVVNIEVASRLRLETDLIHNVRFRRLHDGIPFVVTDVYLPSDIAALVEGAEELQSGATGTTTIIGLLGSRLPHPISQAAQSITVALADESVANQVGCEVGHPMLRVDRLYSDSKARPVELSVSYFLPERYTYRVTLKRTGV